MLNLELETVESIVSEVACIVSFPRQSVGMQIRRSGIPLLNSKHFPNAGAFALHSDEDRRNEVTIIHQPTSETKP
ncbi:hypothetical protein ACFLXQ_09400 [Chloroflexota bacterium]